MRRARLVICIRFVLALAAFMLFYLIGIGKQSADAPTLSGTESLTVKAPFTDEMLLSGISAADKKDGDLTSKVYVDSVSSITDSGVFICTYAVADSDGNVTKLERSVTVEDYTSPEIYLKAPLKVTTRDKFNVLDFFGADDMLDGDISESIRLVASDITAKVSGEYSVTVEVTSSHGDSSSMTASLLIENHSPYRPIIELTEFFVTAEIGSELQDPSKYLASVTPPQGGEEIALSEVSIDTSDLDMTTPGTYTVYYTVAPHGELPTESNTATALLTVSVR